MSLTQEIIRKKRDRQPLSRNEVAEFVQGIADGSVSEGQVAAFAMAVYFNDMSVEERVALTLAQRDSGQVLAWHDYDLPGPLIDKHSTGGVGDLTSLLLGPMVAACGGFVPMISGRGLGHTGGTLDKLAAIPGYNLVPETNVFQRAVREVGVAIIGQTAQLAPADKRIYAIRDVTATVESVAMITASILSKKLAAGLAALTMDIKVGSGAFMPSYEKSQELARSIVDVGNGAGMKTTAVLTDMNQPLASCAGNALEVRYAIDYLTGRIRPGRVHEVTLALATQMLVLGGLAADTTDANARLNAALDSGAAAERFARMVHALGGPADLLEAPGRHLGEAPVVFTAKAPRSGYVTRIDCRALGLTVVGLGGGRRRPEDGIDYQVGLTDLVELGQYVEAGAPLARIHARDSSTAQQAARDIQAACTLAEAPVAVPASVYELID
ncbi:thymidine phosphorylase [Paraburkholderia phenazinium]|jgi:thymidine phosphorylase|uniref:Thymidine phosphorylase n=1 Tax=Paraburkholderia phenazinium TaxID=60549 RepID=A0A1G7RAS0_9BURK|nr:thymidine phosphorylase [Paraburkholderia phenazinium]SDG07906.1 thymidine phosphorylase [Paraburkholderia phenazinium]